MYLASPIARYDAIDLRSETLKVFTSDFVVSGMHGEFFHMDETSLFNESSRQMGARNLYSLVLFTGSRLPHKMQSQSHSSFRTSTGVFKVSS